MLMNPFRRGGGDPHLLVVGMSGVKLGEQFAQIGCANGGRLAAIAKRVGLSGRAMAIVNDDASAARARKGAADAGVLVEIEMAPPTRLPVEDAALDFVVLDDTAGVLSSRSEPERAAIALETLRVLRPGGRVMVMSAMARSGAFARLTGTTSAPPLDPLPVLASQGFKSTRVLAERDGLVFFEGIKPRG
jgi:ubiquinone/menaquinone biosynthesis C-methylase UbiE